MLDPELFSHRFVLSRDRVGKENVKLTLEQAVAIKPDGTVIRWQSQEFPDHYERFQYWWAKGEWHFAYEVALGVEQSRLLRGKDT